MPCSAARASWVWPRRAAAAILSGSGSSSRVAPGLLVYGKAGPRARLSAARGFWSRRTLAAMSDDDDTLDAAAAAAPEPGKGWSEQDRRTLIITVAGGLAANVGTVILVGGAIAFVHLSRGGSVGWRLATALVLAIGGLSMAAVGNALRRGRIFGSRRRDLQARFTNWVLVVFGWLWVLEAMLIVVGLAAGVK
jgi:hypothetical protein